MRHEHLVVTVESGTKARIEDDLESGETVEAWVADAIEEKLSGDGPTDRGTDDRIDEPDDRTGEPDEYDEGFEYVDDCSI